MENEPKKKDVFSFSNGADIDIDVKMKLVSRPKTGENIYFLKEQDARIIITDWNAIFKDKYPKLNYDVFSILAKKQKVYKTKTVEVEYFDWDTWDGKDEIQVIVEEQRYYIQTNTKFNWNTDKYTKALFDLMNSNKKIQGLIVDGETITPVGGARMRIVRGFAYKKKRQFWITSTSVSHKPGQNNKFRWTYGGTALHELVHHFHWLGNKEKNPPLQNHFKIPCSKNTHKGEVWMDWPDGEKERLQILRDETGKK